MNFFDSISTFGTLHAKATKQITNNNKLSKMQEGFMSRATRQISFLKGNGNERDRKWYVARPNDDGTTDYLLGLRNGAALLPLSADMKYVRVLSSERAIEFYEQAIAACRAGQLDDILKATSRKSKGPDVGHVPPGSAASLAN